MKKLIAIICLLAIIVPLQTALAFTLPSHNFPRLVNLYWKTPITKEEAASLARWDILVLSMQAQTDSAETIKYLRRLNPKIIILAYTSANEAPTGRLNIVEPSGTGLWHDLILGLSPEWYLKTFDGQNISWWSGNVSLNLAALDQNQRTYGDYLVDFYQDKVLSTGLWDGLLFDNIWQNVSWVSENIDIDNDGAKDSAEKIDQGWQKGNLDFFSKLRSRIGNGYLILGNGDGRYHAYLNGRMFEGFPEIHEGAWAGSIKRYEASEKNGYQPRLNIINSDTDNTGRSQDYQKMRFGLTSTLLFNGYFSFDWGTELREQFWWYDEYNVSLGHPKSAAFNLFDKNNPDPKASVWQRDFVNGLVLVNATPETKNISFESEYEKIHGTQDAKINNGAIIDHLSLPPEDGIILLRRIEEIKNAVFANGSFARIFNYSGQNVRTGFFAYDQNFKGSTKMIKTDKNHDGEAEIITADKNQIIIYDQKKNKIKNFFPYGEKYQGGLSLAVGDLDQDGKNEIVTGTENGGGNLIKIFETDGQTLNKGFNAYNAKWPRLGVNVAVGDVNGDGQAEIVTGAGAGGGPHVKIFDKNGKLLSNGFFAYNQNFRGGVNVAVGDVNGDGQAEIVTGAGAGGGPHVKILRADGAVLNEWFAYSQTGRNGVRVTAADLDDDGQDEVIALTTNVFTLSYINNFKTLNYETP